MSFKTIQLSCFFRISGKCLLLFLFPLFFPGVQYAQLRDIKFTALTTRDGLSSNIVNHILKDRTGLMWFATEEGLNKYNGKDFKKYYFRLNEGKHAQSVEVSALHEDAHGRLWIGTMGGGLFIYDRKSDSFHSFKLNKRSLPFSHTFITSLRSDYKNRLWVGTMIGIDILDKSAATIQKLKMDDQNREINILNLFEDSKKNMWAGSNQGLFLFSPATVKSGYWKHAQQTNTSIASDTVKTLAEDKYGNIWIGTGNGLNKLSGDKKSISTYKYDAAKTDGIGGNIIHTIVKDFNGDLWIGTDGGLDIFDDQRKTFTHYGYDARNMFSLYSKSVKAIFIDKDGIYWLGTYRGGVNIYDKNLALFNLRQYNKFDPFSLSAALVTSFAEAPSGDIFVGTDGGGLNVFNRKTGLFKHIPLKSKSRINSAGLPILSLLMDSKNQLWVGTFRHGIFVINTQTGAYQQLLDGTGPNQLNNSQIFCFAEDRSGKIWIGTNGGGVNVYDPETKVFTKYTMSPKRADELEWPINGYIRAIEEDKSGNIWIGSFGSGIAVYDPKTKTFKAYSLSNTGLPISKVFCIYNDHKGDTWIGTNGDGLVHFNNKTKKFRLFGLSNGLPNEVVHSIQEDHQGDIWISTNRGLARYNAKQDRCKVYNKNNGLQSDDFITNASLRSRDNLLFFGGVEGMNFFNPANMPINVHAPKVTFTDLTVDNKLILPGKNAPIKNSLSSETEIKLDYKQNFSIGFAALNYTSPSQNSYLYQLQGYDKGWTKANTTNTASYTNIDPGEYVFIVKATNNDGVWSKESAKITIKIRPPFYRTTVAYISYFLLAAGILLYIRSRGIKKLKKEFSLSRERLQRERQRDLDLLRIKFLTNISHDFRTPISLIMAPADKLLEHYKDEKTASQLNVIKRNSRRLLNLVNQLLDFREMEHNEVKLNKTSGELSKFVADVIESFKDLSEQKGITLRLNNLKSNLYVSFDHDKLERVFFNLLSNAFKFTNRGGEINVELNIEDTSPREGYTRVNISVADTGVGISAENKAKVFERFYQEDHNATGLESGNGIGLSIAREFVQLHDGEIDLESTLGKGTTFHVKLSLQQVSNVPEKPAVAPAPSLPSVESKEPAKATGRELPHILIVEDNDELRYYLRDNLEKLYRVTEAVDGKDGWSKALSVHPQLIVSDVSMPNMDGIALIKKIKADKRTAHIPVILLTALSREEDQITGLNSGANDYLTKPFNYEILDAKIRNLLHLNISLKNTYSKQIIASPSDIEITSNDEIFLNKVMLYIEENLNNPQLSVEQLSNHVGMSRSSLYNKMLTLTGHPPVEFIRDYKLEKAAMLLVKSDMTISQISYTAGFATPHYFAKSFKEKYNVIPSQFRIAEQQAQEAQKNPDQTAGV